VIQPEVWSPLPLTGADLLRHGDAALGGSQAAEKQLDEFLTYVGMFEKHRRARGASGTAGQSSERANLVWSSLASNGELPVSPRSFSAPEGVCDSKTIPWEARRDTMWSNDMHRAFNAECACDEFVGVRRHSVPKHDNRSFVASLFPTVRDALPYALDALMPIFAAAGIKQLFVAGGTSLHLQRNSLPLLDEDTEIDLGFVMSKDLRNKTSAATLEELGSNLRRESFHVQWFGEWQDGFEMSIKVPRAPALKSCCAGHAWVKVDVFAIYPWELDRDGRDGALCPSLRSRKGFVTSSYNGLCERHFAERCRFWHDADELVLSVMRVMRGSAHPGCASVDKLLLASTTFLERKYGSDWRVPRSFDYQSGLAMGAFRNLIGDRAVSPVESAAVCVVGEREMVPVEAVDDGLRGRDATVKHLMEGVFGTLDGAAIKTKLTKWAVAARFP
jgi:hypothetical protein